AAGRRLGMAPQRPVQAHRHPNGDNSNEGEGTAVTHTPWASPLTDGRADATPSDPARRHARGPAGLIGQPPDSGPPQRAADLTPQVAALVHELVVAAGRDRDEAHGLARRLADSLTPDARSVLLSALAEADASYEDDLPAVHGSGRAFAHGAGDELLSGDQKFRQVPRSDPPPGLVRLRFADASALERARVAFATRPGTGSHEALSDPSTLTLRIPGDAGVDTLRSVLAVLDAAAVTPETLTVHTRELDDVFAAFTGLP
ncbi:hypothetical protein ACWEEL_28250, partial [Streptomyces sp. NPDC005009]